MLDARDIAAAKAAIIDAGTVWTDAENNHDYFAETYAPHAPDRKIMLFCMVDGDVVRHSACHPGDGHDGVMPIDIDQAELPARRKIIR